MSARITACWQGIYLLTPPIPMIFKRIPSTVLGVVLSLGAFASAAKAELLLTEAQSSQSATAPSSKSDYWELTNFGTSPVSLAGYKWDDDSRSFSDSGAVLIPDGASIAVGESIIFTAMPAADFRAWWGLPDSVQVFSLPSPGLGSGDGIALFDAAQNEIFFFSYAANGFTKSDGTLNATGHTGIAAGSINATDALIYDPTFGTASPRYTFADGIKFGTFTAAVGTDIGSPGRINSPLALTEIQSSQSASAPASKADYWELTNFSANDISIAGYKWDDNSRSFNDAEAVLIPDGAAIHAYESVIFTSMPVADFRAWWGLPDTVQVFSLPSPGLGSGDGVALFDAAGNEIFFFNYAANGFTKSDGTLNGTGHTGIAAGSATATDALIWDPAFGNVSPRYTFADGIHNGSFTAAVGTDRGSPGFAVLPTAVDLSKYIRIGRYDLPEPTRTTPPDAVSLLAQEASGVTFNWDTNTLFITADGGTSIVQVTKTGQLIDSMTLAPGSSPQGTTFYDPEGITYVGNGQFVMSEERDRQLVLFTYVAGSTLTRNDTKTVKLGTFVSNTGTEGLSYDPQTGGFICLKEIDPQGIFQTAVDFDAGTASNGSPTTGNSIDLFDPTLAGMLDLADVFALSNIPSMNGHADSSHLLLLSQESAKIVNIDRDGNISNSLTIQSDPGNPLTAAAQQHEGLTMDRNGILYVVSENGGGDFDHPQLWVYAPSTVPNQAPTVVALNNEVTAIVENTSTGSRVKVADIDITDDGLGTNELTVTGTDASYFEIVASSLYIKAGTILDFETKASYSITINVDDTSLGATPDASVAYVLTVTDLVDETVVLPTIIISETAPWSSGNSPIGADWFELTNTGTTAVDITGWKVDDSSASFASALELNGITSIAPGESVVFIETSDLPGMTTTFLANWFGANPPAGLRIGSYSGGGIGLSTGGDAVNLYDASGVLQARVSFGASPTGPSFPTFNNAEGLDNTVISTPSVVGVNGAFAAVNNPAEIGSPGSVGRLIISEVAPWSSTNSPFQTDWFELTNTSAHTIDITGWKVDDSSESFAAALALNGITSIAAGESVIFMETDDLGGKGASFLSTWFGASPPAGLQIGSYTGGGIGLSTSGDAVNLYNSSGVLQAKVFFAASPSGPTFPTFDNAAGINNAAISQLSSVGLNGAFIAANDSNEIGSPGTAAIGGTPSVTLTVSITPASFSESAANPAAIGTVSRSGDTIGDLVVTLASSDVTEASVPTTVTILAGQSSVNFDVTAVDDSSADNDQTATITASAGGTNSGTFDVTVSDDGDVAVPNTLLITEILSNESGSAPAGAEDYWELTNLGSSSVDLSGYKWTDSSGADIVTIPNGISIAAGESIIFTAALAVDFRTWWGITESVQVISAQTPAPGLGSSDGVKLLDPADTQVLFLSYAAAGFKQPNGTDSAGGHAGISAGGSLAYQSLVWDPASGSEDPRYTFATGTTLGTFVAAIGADIGSPGVSSSGVESSLTLTLGISPATFAENAANPAATGTVTRDGSTAADLVVTLSSADETEATVPATVTILAGQTSATFAVTAVNDAFPDGDKTFNLSANAEDADLVNFEITVQDDGDVVGYNLMLTELQSSQSASGPSSANDYWELTNFGDASVSLANFTWHDSGRSYAVSKAWKLPSGSSIAAGESVIFTTMTPAAFRAWWGISETVQVFQAPGGPGLGKNDGISLFEEGGNEVFFFSYAASGFTRADETPSTGDHAGLSAGGEAESQALIWVPSSGTTTPRYTAATGTNFGSFQPSIGGDLGSPGISDGISPPMRDASIVTRGPLKLGRVSTLNLAGSEISAYDTASKRIFVTCSSGLQVVDISDPATPTLLTTVTFTEAPISLPASDVTSVDCFNGTLAVALPNPDKSIRGYVVFLNAADGSYLGKAQVGYHPDQVTFTPDGRHVLTSDEGEVLPDGTDPTQGTVSIIDVTSGFNSPTAMLADFTAYDAQAAALKAAGVRIFEVSPGVLKLPSLDFEPEYLAVSADSRKAMVTLQEANAVAILDIATATFTSVMPLGEKDFSTLLADFSDRDGPGDTALINLTTGNPVFGMYMPDTIASFKVGLQTYYVIANEGDDRNDFLPTPESTTVGNGAYILDPEVFPNAAELKTNARLGRLTVSNAPGLRGDTDGDGDIDRILMYGGRSFSILDSTGAMIYDSGDDIEKTLASIGDPLFDDGRSDNKGPEPEGVKIGVIDGRTYAFIGLERHRSVIIYDVTDPANVTQAGLVSFPEDLNPEGITFISAKNSPNGIPMIATTNESSNTLTLFTVESPNYTLQLMHFSDAESGLLAPETAPYFAAMVDAFEESYDNTLILSSGDNFIPSPFLNAGTDPSLNNIPFIGSTAFARPDIAILNQIGVEASAIGNHEWDLGSAVFTGALGSSGTWVGAQFPYMSLNLDFSADSAANGRFTDVPLNGLTTLIPESSAGKGRIVPTAVITKGGEKIGLVAVTTQLIESISSPSGTEVKGFPTGAGPNGESENMDLLASQIQPYINELIAEGVNKIVLMSHLQQIANERSLATKLSGVDIIIAGGSNTRLGDADDVAVAFPGHEAEFDDTYPIITAGTDSQPTLIVNTDGEFSYLGRLTLEFNTAGEIIVSNLADRVVTNGAYASTAANVAAAWGVAEEELATTAFAPGSKGAAVKQITDAVLSVINSKDGTIFGYTQVYLEGERSFVRSEETNFGSITADANSAALRGLVDASIPIVSLKNGGGIRAQIGSVSEQGVKLPPAANPAVNKVAGGISQLDIENALRFNNTLMTFQTTPQGLKAILEHGVALWPNQGRFPQIGGIAFSWDPDRPANDRIVSMSLIDENDEMTTPLFKDGLFSFLAPSVIQVVTLNFLANNGDGYPIKANGSHFQYLLADGTLGPVIDDESVDFTVSPALPGNPLGEQKTFSDYISSRYATLQTAYAIADTEPSGDHRIQNLNYREDAVVPFDITTDTDGDGITDVEELAYGGNPDAGLRVGDQVDFDFSVLVSEGNKLTLIGKLPAGLKFDPATGTITGQISGNPGYYPLQFVEMDGKVIVRSFTLNMNITAFPAALLGKYETLLEVGDSPQPKGVVRVFVSRAGQYTASLEYVGASRRSAKGSFTLTPGSNIAELNLSFPSAKSVPALTAQILVASDSPLVSGTYTAASETGTQRGFRLTATNANPPAVQKIVSVWDAGAQDGVDYPAGLGWTKGSVSKTGVIKMKGLLGDGKAATMSLNLSATGQALVWSQPYKNKESYIGGIISMGNLGQPLNLPQRLTTGLQWFKAADSKEPSYAEGFEAPLAVTALSSTFVPEKKADDLADSLGLIANEMAVEIEGAGLSNGAPNDAPVLPTQFTLDSKFNLQATAPDSPVTWKGKFGKADGSFTGTLTLPTGKAAATGVILQDDELGAIIGGGQIKVPVTGNKRAFRTSAILLEQE